MTSSLHYRGVQRFPVRWRHTFFLLFMPVSPKHHRREYPFPNTHTHDLCKAIMQCNSVDECENFLRDLCTLKEIRTLSERWYIAKRIWQGFPYRTIIQETGASSTTIARVSHWVQFGNGGFRTMCKRCIVDDRYPEEMSLGKMMAHAA